MRGAFRIINVVAIFILLLFIGTSVFVHSVKSDDVVRKRRNRVKSILMASSVMDRIHCAVKTRPLLFYQPELAHQTEAGKRLAPSDAVPGIVTVTSQDVVDIRDTGISVPDDLSENHYPPVKEIVVTVRSESLSRKTEFELRTVQTHP